MSATDPVLAAPVIDSTADAERSTGMASPLKITVPGYADFTAGDTVTLYWDGTAVSGGEYIVPDGEGDQPITFTIPTRAIADTPGGTSTSPTGSPTGPET
ncbi:hypothetical protein [Streptomyces sp. NPDC056049]|uniref:hypothetical protein n=1 Tax=Streptomyces sp. NPDC056049 TaxID=3345693 RepID=UPI0035D73056